MDQLTVVGRKDLTRDVLQALQNLGVVHVDPLELPTEGGLERMRLAGGEKVEEERWNAVRSRSTALLQILAPYGAQPPARDDVPGTLHDAESWLRSAGASVDALVAERADARDELDLIQSYLPAFRVAAPTLSRLEESEFLEGNAVIVSSREADGVREALKGELEGRAEFGARPHGDDTMLLIATLREDRDVLRRALGRLGLAALELPLRYQEHGTAKAVHVMEERSQALPRRLAAVEEELARLAASFGGKLAAVHALAANHAGRFEVMGNLGESRWSFALQGWVPSDRTKKVVDSLRKQFGDDIQAVTRAADAHHDHHAPTKLENKSWARPFELLLSLFDPPRYGSFDPTWTVALFFPLYFGIVVGDMGFGLAFLLLGLWLGRRGQAGKDLSLGPLGIVIPSVTLPKIGAIVVYCAVWTILWGFVYGEFFGNFLEHWPHGNPVFWAEGHTEGMIKILLFRVEVFNPLLIMALGFGVLQVVGGWVVRAYYGALHHDRKHLFEGIGMAAGLTAITLFAWAFLSGNLGTPVYIAVAIGMALFLVGVVVAGMPLMLVELISNSGHILSYLRLFAVGLSAALVANLATDLGFAIAGGIPVPVLGALLGIIVALIVHTLAIALTIIGHTLQPLRLQYVEFFTKFGFYEHPGRAYKPFGLSGGKA